PAKPTRQHQRIKKRGTVNINLEIKSEIREKLLVIAIEEDRSVSSVIRQIIKKHLGQTGK
ncbi:unnamed protein product, partial [marine sediment metagenome]